MYDFYLYNSFPEIETDSPYMSPDTGERNDPRTIARGIEVIAKVKGMTKEDVSGAVMRNFERLFGLSK